MATSLHAPALCVDGDHSVCLARPVEFAEALLRACRSVLERSVRERSVLEADQDHAAGARPSLRRRTA